MTRSPRRPRAASPLAAAVRLSGGLRSVAAAAGVDAADLGKFLRGGGGMSEESVARVEAALGWRGGGTDPSRVQVLRTARADGDLVAALQWHFPQGARLARIAWTAGARARAAKWIRGASPPGVYAATDGVGRAVVLVPADGLLPLGLFPEAFPDLLWWEGDPDRAVLGVADPVPWVAGRIAVPDFDAAWPGPGYDPGAGEVLDAVRRLGIGYAEAIRRLHRG